jgi:hypothetical protein
MGAYGKTASGKQITDELIDVLARRAEAGYEIEELRAPPRGRSAVRIVDDLVVSCIDT